MEISGSQTSSIEKKIGETLFGKISSNSKKNSNLNKSGSGNEKATSSEASINASVFKQTIEHEDGPVKVKLEEKEITDGLPPWLPKLKEGVIMVEPLAEIPQKSKQVGRKTSLTFNKDSFT